jgi:hypothetical protein
LGKWADQVLPGIGSAVQKFSDALSDTVSKFAANNKENKAAAAAAARGEAPGPSKSPFLATPTSFLSWFVDYQQTMQCYYMCLG